MEKVQAINEQVVQVVEEGASGGKRTEILFGVIMAVAAIAGIWGAVSLMISWFIAT